MSSDILYGRESGKLKNIPLKGFGVTTAPICKSGVHLPDQETRHAENPLNRQGNPDGFPSDGNDSKSPGYCTPTCYLPGTAMRTNQFVGFVGDREYHSPASILGVDVLVALDTKGMIQKTRGHEGASPLFDLQVFKEENPIVHISSTPKVR
jgi:hypothetical protein